MSMPLCSGIRKILFENLSNCFGWCGWTGLQSRQICAQRLTGLKSRPPTVLRLETRVRVKICGVKRPADARACIEAGADAIGLNFVPESPRCIGGIPAARALIDAAGAPAELQWAGVFVNPSHDFVLECVQRLGIRIVQLHGEESPLELDRLRQALPPEATPLESVSRCIAC